jgi:hypothetical protein
VTRKNLPVFIYQNRIVEAESLDTIGNLLGLLGRVNPGISLVGGHLIDRDQLNPAIGKVTANFTFGV